MNSLLTRREEFTRTNSFNLTDSAIPADWNLAVRDDVTEDDHHIVTVHFLHRVQRTVYFFLARRSPPIFDQSHLDLRQSFTSH